MYNFIKADEHCTERENKRIKKERKRGGEREAEVKKKIWLKTRKDL